MKKRKTVIHLLASTIMTVGISISAIQVEASNYTVNELTIHEHKFNSDIFAKPLDTLNATYEARKEELARIAAEEAERARLEEEERQRQIQAASYSAPVYSSGGGLTRSGGVNWHNGWRETWYSSNVLYHYRTGEWTVGADGVYRDSDGYVIVSSSSEAQGTVTDTSFGPGKVYDTGCAQGTHDIYTNW